jgi:hypothetical protein
VRLRLWDEVTKIVKVCYFDSILFNLGLPLTAFASFQELVADDPIALETYEALADILVSSLDAHTFGSVLLTFFHSGRSQSALSMVIHTFMVLSGTR